MNGKGSHRLTERVCPRSDVNRGSIYPERRHRRWMCPRARPISTPAAGSPSRAARSLGRLASESCFISTSETRLPFKDPGA